MSEAKPAPPRRRAAALRYDPGIGEAPVVVAAGQGITAENIVSAATAAGVPVRLDPQLAAALAQLEIGTEIPSNLYTAVAELLAWVISVDSAAAGKFNTIPAADGATPHIK